MRELKNVEKHLIYLQATWLYSFKMRAKIIFQIISKITTKMKFGYLTQIKSITS